MEKNIKQAIITFLKSTDAHPTASKIFLTLEKNIGPIDKKIFLETLNSLEKEKEITSIASINKIKHYDIKHYHHYHFICSDCGNIQDLYLEPGAINMLTNYAQHLINSFGKIEKINLSFQGICHNCRKK